MLSYKPRRAGPGDPGAAPSLHTQRPGSSISPQEVQIPRPSRPEGDLCSSLRTDASESTVPRGPCHLPGCHLPGWLWSLLQGGACCGGELVSAPLSFLTEREGPRPRGQYCCCSAHSLLIIYWSSAILTPSTRGRHVLFLLLGAHTCSLVLEFREQRCALLRCHFLNLKDTCPQGIHSSQGTWWSIVLTENSLCWARFSSPSVTQPENTSASPCRSSSYLYVGQAHAPPCQEHRLETQRNIETTCHGAVHLKPI